MMLSCAKLHQKQSGKGKRNKQNQNTSTLCCFISLVHYGTEQKPDLGLALLKLPLHTIIKVETTRAVKQRILLLLVPAYVI